MNLGRLKRRWKHLLLCLAACFILSIAFPNIWILTSTNDFVFRSISNVPSREVGVLLGTDKIRLNGTTNFHFVARVQAAKELYDAGKIKTLLVSGHPNNNGFNEPFEMKKELIARGVPSEVILVDEGGQRTIRTVERVKDVYDLKEVITITDSFHANRSVFLYRRFGIDAVAYCAKDEPGWFWPVSYRVRELLARTKAVLDVAYATLE